MTIGHETSSANHTLHAIQMQYSIQSALSERKKRRKKMIRLAFITKEKKVAVGIKYKTNPKSKCPANSQKKKNRSDCLISPIGQNKIDDEKVLVQAVSRVAIRWGSLAAT